MLKASTAWDPGACGRVEFLVDELPAPYLRNECCHSGGSDTAGDSIYLGLSGWKRK